MIRLVQLIHGSTRHVALVEEPRLRLLEDVASIFDLAQTALGLEMPLDELIQQRLTEEILDYDSIYRGESDWRLLPAVDHPNEPALCLVSGTGLTHLGSAKNRNSMHNASPAESTDSMKMFRLGVEGGKPATGKIGVTPEWFYKGCGTILRAHNESLVVPSYGEDGGEEAELAGVYIIDAEGHPRRIGMCVGNEFSDHKFEKKNYLNLANSKIRTCSLGPELVINPGFQSVPGSATIIRNGHELWKKEILTGEAEMCHGLGNIEHHHFKFETHRRPGDVHVHYFGACALSFGDGIQLADGDVMEIQFEGFGRPLRNSLKIMKPVDSPVLVKTL